MTAGTLIELQANFKALNLTSMARNLEGSLRQARESGIGYDEFLIELTAAELQARAENSLNRRIREAKFPLLKPMETFDLSAVPELDLRLFRDLAGGDYIREHRNVIFSGHSGAGKTHMAIALGIEACKNNFRTRFVTCYGLVNELIEARQERTCNVLSNGTSDTICSSWTNSGISPFPRKGRNCSFRSWRKDTRKGQ